MAKKILYKTTAYHCPRCGGTTEPTKKYCEFCERDLGIRSENHNKNAIRLLVNCEEFIYFDSLTRFETIGDCRTLDCTCLEDNQRHYMEPRGYGMRFTIWLPSNRRSIEILNRNYQGIKTIRLEHLGADIGFEAESYVGNVNIEMASSNEISMTEINFVTVSPPVQGKAIPDNILSEMRCPNCGAPIKSRYGACDYCSGWSEVEW